MKKISSAIYKILMKTSLGRNFINKRFQSSAAYWESRYVSGGNSGKGSYGANAIYKANVLNEFVKDHGITKVIEWGSGDGNQLKSFTFPYYMGVDVSITATDNCKLTFKYDTTKTFFCTSDTNLEKAITGFDAELALSLDVIYHLVEEESFEKYMRRLFSSSKRFVAIYAWDVISETKFHVRHRKFTDWISANAADWELYRHIEKTEVMCDFFFFERKR